MWNDKLPRDVLSEILTNPKLSIENNIIFSLNLDDDSLSEYKRLDFPLKDPEFRVVDCLNGVVCLSNKDNDKIVLWNPSIKKLLKLPKPTIPFCSFSVVSIGFSFDAATYDFKVVRVLTYWLKNISKSTGHRAEVYELSLGRWRRIKEEATDWSTPSRVSSEYQALLNGVVHWVGANKCILTFDFRNEVFGRIDMPADFGITQYWNYNLRVYVIGGESLSLIYHKLNSDGRTCVIWVMKEYGVSASWLKLYTVSNAGINLWELISTRLNGELFMKKVNAPWLYSYVSDTKHVQRLKMYQSRYFVVVNFTESLALVGVKGGLWLE